MWERGMGEREGGGEEVEEGGCGRGVWEGGEGRKRGKVGIKKTDDRIRVYFRAHSTCTFLLQLYMNGSPT